MKLGGWILLAGALAAIHPVTSVLVDLNIAAERQAEAETAYTQGEVEALNNLVASGRGRNEFRGFKMTDAERNAAMVELYGRQ